ncbi:MAG: radical SAM protein [Deltaproteobacteria bacterium HGW-Deltaproteobacteria-15]|jgi:biotin synthase|nr:MAG: radical SAM protein [Deltaproteobacteria bacterium HGW-Deltaproteobacteria-15]
MLSEEQALERTEPVLESPDYVRMSLAAAMTLGFKQGLFYRDARLFCINLLLTYPEGCAARCAYCGLSRKRPGTYSGKSFIRVTWPTYSMDEVAERISRRTDRVKRVCISMVTRKRAVGDTREICARLRSAFDVPVSLLVAPTVLSREDFVEFRKAGADKIGVAIDLATAVLFDRFRGSGTGGPHKWERYWQALSEALSVFGEGNAGAHFMVGMGETEKEMCQAIERVRRMGGRTHLFSFFPEAESEMADHRSPPIAQYRRIQLARFLLDESISAVSEFDFDSDGRIRDFGLPPEELERIIDSGEPFRTSGCAGYDGQVACNRPYANSRPGPGIRNFPFPPDGNDLKRIRRQLGLKKADAGSKVQDA